MPSATYYLGSDGAAYFHPSTLLTVGTDGDATNKTAWLGGLQIVDEVVDVGLQMITDVANTTPRPRANFGWHENVVLPRRCNIAFNVFWKGHGSSALMDKLLLDWNAGLMLGMAFFDREEKPRWGLIGNWIVSINHNQNLKSMQGFPVSLTPGTYVEWVFDV